MGSVLLPPPHDIQTTVNYAVPFHPTEPLFKHIFDPPPGQQRRNYDFASHQTTVHDVRGTPLEHDTDLDVHGFRFVRHVSAETDFDDDERIRRMYYPEIEALLRKLIPEARRVHIFDHTLRRKAVDSINPNDGRGPALRVHADQTFTSGRSRVYVHLPEEADRLLKNRVRIINVWRPIVHPAYHRPLAVADWRTVRVGPGPNGEGTPEESDFLPTKRIHPVFEGQTYNLRYNPGHVFYYMSEQTPEECLVIKCWDSVEDNKIARATPHTSIVDPRSDPGQPSRESIEMRVFVFDGE